MSGPYEDEIMRLRLLSAAHPNVRILTHLAEAYRKAGDLERAREAAERGIARHAEYPGAYVVLGRVLWEMGERADAEQAFRRVLELDPENRVAREWLSHVETRGAPKPGAAATMPPLSTPAGDNGNGRYDRPAGPATGSARRSVVAGYQEAATSAPPAPPPPEARRPVRAYLSELLAYRPTHTPTAAASRPAEGDTNIVALTDLLIGLLEYRDPLHRGGSSLTRLIAVAIGRELGMDARQLDDLALAALLRDLGRLALGWRLVEEAQAEPDEEARRRIEGHVELALKLLEGIALPPGVRAAIRHHHERWDGAGYPDRLSGEAIPLAARVLAVADSLSAMISPRPYRPPRRLAAAIAEIQAQAGTNYDPDVVGALIRTLPYGLRRRALEFGLRHHVIVVDADRSRALAIAARLGSHGFLAQAAANPDDARERMRRFPADAVLLAADLPGDATVTFLDALRAEPGGADVAVVAIHADTVARRIELLERGADVCFASTVAFEELRAGLAALLKRHAPAIERGGREPGPGRRSGAAPWHALRGELNDFPLTWLLQVLQYDARTAAIVVRGGEQQGTVYVEDGNPVHAHTVEAVGDEALKSMLQWKKGSFDVLPEARAPARSIQRSIMHLLLESAVERDHSGVIFGAIRSDD